MSRSTESLQIEPDSFQRVEGVRWHVIQAIEPKAKQLLRQAGGTVRLQGNCLSEEPWDARWPLLLITWPPNTRSVYVSPSGQEDQVTIFQALLVPGGQDEFHLTYDYRFFSLFGTFEEFFTLRVAARRILGVLRDRQ